MTKSLFGIVFLMLAFTSCKKNPADFEAAVKKKPTAEDLERSRRRAFEQINRQIQQRFADKKKAARMEETAEDEELQYPEYEGNNEGIYYGFEDVGYDENGYFSTYYNGKIGYFSWSVVKTSQWELKSLVKASAPMTPDPDNPYRIAICQHVSSALYGWTSGWTWTESVGSAYISQPPIAVTDQCWGQLKKQVASEPLVVEVGRARLCPYSVFFYN